MHKCDKTNYRRVNILPIISKISKKIIYTPIYEYFNDKLFPSQSGFRKGFSSKHSLLVMSQSFTQTISR